MIISRNTSLALILVVIIGVVGTISYYNWYVYVETHEVPLVVEIVQDEKMGFNVDTHELNFGKLPVLGRTRKAFDVTNDQTFPVLATFTPDPAVAGGIAFDPVRPVIQPGETERITVRMSGQGIPVGKHNTTLLVTLTRS